MRFFESKKQKERQTRPPEARSRDLQRTNSLWRRLRIVEARLNAQEAQSSTLRRDVNRIDRRAYPRNDGLSEADFNALLKLNGIPPSEHQLFQDEVKQ